MDENTKTTKREWLIIEKETFKVLGREFTFNACVKACKRVGWGGGTLAITHINQLPASAVAAL